MVRVQAEAHSNEKGKNYGYVKIFMLQYTANGLWRPAVGLLTGSVNLLPVVFRPAA